MSRNNQSISTPRKRRAEVLLDDDHVLVLNKPGGTLHEPDPESDEPCTLDLLVPRPESLPLLAWGLDDPASGVVIYAKNEAARDRIAAQVADNTLTRQVLVMVDGFVSEDGEIDLPLRYDRRQKRQKVSRSRGYPAATRYAVKERLAGNTVLECEPQTNHRDQVRVHLRAIGHPLTVDPRYGGGTAVMLSRYKADYRPNVRKPERPLIDRLTLHAFRVTFRHPATDAVVTCEAPLPKDFRAAITQLRRLA